MKTITSDFINQKKQNGFTLIELMIVVAIIGILASIAIPSYKDYIVRAKLSEAIVFAGACKTSVMEFYAVNRSWPVDTLQSGCSNVSTPDVVRRLDVSNGIIIVGIYGTRTGIGFACQIELAPNTDGSVWTGSSNCPKKYLPATFR